MPIRERKIQRTRNSCISWGEMVSGTVSCESFPGMAFIKNQETVPDTVSVTYNKTGFPQLHSLDLLGRSEVRTTMIYTHVLNCGPGGRL